MQKGGYTKLFGRILASTIWQESKETRLVWITMLAMADRDGFVDASIPGLADMAKVPMADCEVALKKFLGPDGYSRTKENEGRRIEEVDGGWRLLNHAKYRDKMDADDRREDAAIRQASYRDRQNWTPEQKAAWKEERAKAGKSGKKMTKWDKKTLEEQEGKRRWNLKRSQQSPGEAAFVKAAESGDTAGEDRVVEEHLRRERAELTGKVVEVDDSATPIEAEREEDIL